MLARPALRHLPRRLPRRHRPLLGLVRRPRGPGPRRHARRAARESAGRPLLAVLHPRPVPAGAPLQRRSREGDPARQGRALAARRRRRPRRVLDGALPPPRGAAGDDRRPAGERQRREGDRRRGWDERPRPPPGRRHVRGRLRRPLRRRPLLQHHPPPLAGADPRRSSPASAPSCDPGAPLCVLDLYDRPGGQRANLASILGLFFHLTSGADTYTVEEVSRWMGESGYGRPR